MFVHSSHKGFLVPFQLYIYFYLPLLPIPIVQAKTTEAVDDKPAVDPQFAEPVVDQMRAQKDQVSCL